MTDYKEEQQGEIEALESIYIDEMQLEETSPYHTFTLTVVSTDDTCYGQDEPDQSKHWVLPEHQKTAEENLGMVMVFTIVSAVQDSLHDIGIRIKTEREEAEDKKKQAEDEAEQKRFEGIRVNVETFMAWKKKFDAEMEEQRRRRGHVIKVVKGLTGRELFLTDHSMDDSDVQFLDEADAAKVEVDESLFQDLDDLDLGADLELET